MYRVRSISLLRIISFILILAFLTACGQENAADKPSPTASPEPFPQIRVTVSEALVFAHPSREAAVLFRLIEGDQMNILAHTAPDDFGVPWYQVGQGEEFGWIAGSQVTISGDLNKVRLAALTVPPTTPLPTEIIPTFTSVPDTVEATISSDEAVIYQQPDMSSGEVTRLLRDEVSDIIGRFTDAEGVDTFYFLGRERIPLGWVHAADVTVSGDITTIPIVSEVLNSVLPTEIGQVITPATSIAVTPTLTPTGAATTRPTPFPTATSRISPTPVNTIDFASTSQAASTATDFPSDETPTLTMTPAPIREGIPPPLVITLPEGWESAHASITLNTAYLQGDLPVSLYSGPLSNDAIGTIWLIWGFPNITDPISGQMNLYADGVQLLRSMVLDPNNCTIGLGSERRQYRIGGFDAVGTIYSASPCLDNTDVAGFFAVMHLNGMNFAFFTGVEPVDQVSGGLREIQTILDSIEFDREALGLE